MHSVASTLLGVGRSVVPSQVYQAWAGFAVEQHLELPGLTVLGRLRRLPQLSGLGGVWVGTPRPDSCGACVAHPGLSGLGVLEIFRPGLTGLGVIDDTPRPVRPGRNTRSVPGLSGLGGRSNPPRPVRPGGRPTAVGLIRPGCPTHVAIATRSIHIFHESYQMAT